MTHARGARRPKPGWPIGWWSDARTCVRSAPPCRSEALVTHDNLLGGPTETLLPTDPAQALLVSGRAAQEVVRAYPASSLAWALLAERALDEGRDIDAYAYARVGYHRGLDSLRRNGWRGHGPVPYAHVPNRGFLR